MKTQNLIQSKNYADLFKMLIVSYQEQKAYLNEVRERRVRFESQIETLVKTGQIHPKDVESKRNAFIAENNADSSKRMAKIGNIARALAEEIYKVLGSKPNFETIDNNFRIEILLEDSEELSQYIEFFAQFAGMFVETESSICVLDGEGVLVYPKLESVLRELKELELVKVEDEKAAFTIKAVTKDYILKNASPAVWVQNLVNDFYMSLIKEKK